MRLLDEYDLHVKYCKQDKWHIGMEMYTSRKKNMKNSMSLMENYARYQVLVLKKLQKNQESSKPKNEFKTKGRAEKGKKTEGIVDGLCRYEINNYRVIQMVRTSRIAKNRQKIVWSSVQTTTEDIELLKHEPVNYFAKIFNSEMWRWCLDDDVNAQKGQL